MIVDHLLKNECVIHSLQITNFKTLGGVKEIIQNKQVPELFAHFMNEFVPVNGGFNW
jgi:hypothetical protein